MKTCPFCAEEIQDRALKCRHCGSWLPQAPDAPAAPQTANAAHSQTEVAAVPGDSQGTPAAAPPRDAEPTIGPKGKLPEGYPLGNFVITNLIGQGGMGEVYRARHREINREVAVKVLARAMSEHAEAMERFRREADMANAVQHDAVVKVHDFGRLPDERHYYIMDILRGEALADLLERRSRVDLAECAVILTPVIDALGAAHAAGIIHRDVKPDNIFLDTGHQGERRVRVLDFGIAKLTDPTAADASVTQTGQILGTPLYMSPEQVGGASDQVGPHSDIYAVAAVLFHMLTGQPPVSGANVQQLMVKKVTSEAPSVLSLRPDLPPALDGVLKQALATDPAQRFRDMPSFKAALVNGVPGWVQPGAPPTSGPLPVVTPAPGPAMTPSPVAPASATPPAPTITGHPAGAVTSLSGAAAEVGLPPGRLVEKPSKRWVKALALIGGGVVLVAAVAGGLVLGLGGQDGDGGERTSASGVDQTDPDMGPASPASPGDPAARRRPPARPSRVGQMVRLKAGCFQMGRAGQDPDEVPVHRVCLDAFELDRTEVTVAEYARCVQTGTCSAPRSFGGDEKWKKRCNWGAPGRQRHPVNCLTWFQAREFCAWAGKRLPTEAEWEYAARGAGNRFYPWGRETPSCDRVVMESGGVKGCGRSGTWPVGSKPAGATPEGLLDMAGNVWEWVEDCWFLKAYRKCASGCRNPVHACTDRKRKRVIRGGSFSVKPEKAERLRTSVRGYYRPYAVGQGVGLRCARSVSAARAHRARGHTRAGTAPSGTGAGWVRIPAGCFTQGSTEGDRDETPPHEVCLAAFRMSRTEITVAQYRACVTAGKCETPDAHMDNPDKWQSFCNWNAPGRDKHPVNCVTWPQAQAYCVAQGGRLPTEAEWELAARGPRSRRYPWGNTAPSCDRVVMKNSAGHGCGGGHTLAVGSKPAGASPRGVQDLIGNVWEWIHDCYDRQFYGFCGDDCKNPRNAVCSPLGRRIKRGGSYGDGVRQATHLRASFRGTWAYGGRSPRIGFRCVLPAPRAPQTGTPFDNARPLAITRIKASSHLPPFHGFKFLPKHVLDGRLRTSWQPRGSKEDSKGQWIKLWFGRPARVVGLSVANGFQRTKNGEDLFYINSRLAQVSVHYSDGTHHPLAIPTDKKGFVHLPLKPRKATWLLLKIEAIERGNKWRDVAVSELRVWEK